MSSFLFWSSIGCIVGLSFSSFFEWLLHRFLMHRPVGIFRYPFERHALVHHHIFKADHTYHLVEEKDKHTIPMAWWNGPVLVALCQIPFVIIVSFTGTWWLVVGSLISCTAYYCTCEYIHWCMHLPKARIVARSGTDVRLNGHHLVHHRYMHKNFNVVLPLADMCLGTLLTRSPIHFAQPTGPSVPNVQPMTPPPQSTGDSPSGSVVP